MIDVNVILAMTLFVFCWLLLVFTMLGRLRGCGGLLVFGLLAVVGFGLVCWLRFVVCCLGVILWVFVYFVDLKVD